MGGSLSNRLRAVVKVYAVVSSKIHPIPIRSGSAHAMRRRDPDRNYADVNYNEIVHEDPAADGLEVFEFVLEIEDALGITVPDADAETIYTPRDLVAYLEQRLDATAGAARIGERASSRLLAAVQATLPTDRCEVSAETRWSELIPEWDRRTCWNELEATLGLSLNPVESPSDGFVGRTSTWVQAGSILLVPTVLLAVPLLDIGDEKLMFYLFVPTFFVALLARMSRNICDVTRRNRPPTAAPA